MRICFILFYSIVSCGKKELEIHKPLPDSRYPFACQILTSSQYEQLNSELAKANTHDSLYLNKLGFLEGKIFLGSNDTFKADLFVSYWVYIDTQTGDIIKKRAA